MDLMCHSRWHRCWHWEVCGLTLPRILDSCTEFYILCTSACRPLSIFANIDTCQLLFPYQHHWVGIADWLCRPPVMDMTAPNNKDVDGLHPRNLLSCLCLCGGGGGGSRSGSWGHQHQVPHHGHWTGGFKAKLQCSWSGRTVSCMLRLSWGREWGGILSFACHQSWQKDSALINLKVWSQQRFARMREPQNQTEVVWVKLCKAATICLWMHINVIKHYL